MTNITIIDQIDAETIAMAQAFYSRSHESITDRLLDLNSNNAEIKASFAKYYIGYGHESIADCGTLTLFIEGVSLLAAKVIQDFPLYNGQESSTRYIDFSKQNWIEVNSKYNNLNQDLINFYLQSRSELFEHLTTIYPGDRKDPKYTKAIQCKVFDILRAFIPGGTKTQLSWHVTLRQLRARLIELSYHPLLEIKNLCKDIINNLIIKYPDTFSNIYEAIEERCEFYHEYFHEIYYNEIYDEDIHTFKSSSINYTIMGTANWNISRFKRKSKKDPIPRALELLPDILFEFQLDYGSARDLLRHRRGYIPLPILDMRLGFNTWYLNQLSQPLKDKAITLLNNNRSIINSSDLNKYEKQYYTPIGYSVPMIAKLSMQQIVYIIELRSSKNVHPTLRQLAQNISKIIKSNTHVCDIFCDYEDDSLNLKRAEQDIVLK